MRVKIEEAHTRPKEHNITLCSNTYEYVLDKLKKGDFVEQETVKKILNYLQTEGK